MNTSNKDESTSSELPDAVWKALIAEKLKEYEGNLQKFIIKV